MLPGGRLLVCLGLLVWLGIWAFAGFRDEALRVDPKGEEGPYAAWPAFLQKNTLSMKLIGLCRDRRLLPEFFLFAYAETLDETQKRAAFLNGVQDSNGFLSYFPYCLMAKSNPALFVLMALARPRCMAAPRTRAGRSWNPSTGSPLLVLVAIYWSVAIGSRINLGHRHQLPIYPPLFIISGGAAWWMTGVGSRAARFRQGLVGLVLMLGLVEAARVWPNYLSYMNFLEEGMARLISMLSTARLTGVRT